MSSISPSSLKGIFRAEHILEGDQVGEEVVCFSFRTEVGEDSVDEVVGVS